MTREWTWEFESYPRPKNALIYSCIQMPVVRNPGCPKQFAEAGMFDEYYVDPKKWPPFYADEQSVPHFPMGYMDDDMSLKIAQPYYCSGSAMVENYEKMFSSMKVDR